MKRKLIGGSLAVVLAVFAVWWFAFRDRGDDKPADPGGRSAAIPPTPKAPEHQPEAEPEAPRGAAPRWSLDVDPAGPIILEGQVLGPDGAGVPKAEVWLGSVPPRTVIAEDDGTFSFDKLVGRTYAISARSGTLLGGPITYKLTGKSDPAVIHLVEGARVVVSVVDQAKRPIAGVAVKAGFTIEATAQTDAKGEATLAPITPGYVFVEATAPGYAAGTGFTTVGSAGASGRLTITLRSGVAVSGRVIDDNGKPIAKARVSLGGGGGMGWEDFAARNIKDPSSGTTDERGQFTIAAVEAGTHSLHAVDGEHAPARSAPITVADRAVTGVEIKMKAGGVLSGTVVDATSQPVAFATVRIAGAGERMAQVAGRQATTDEAGAFVIRGIARTKLQARAESDTAASKLVDFDLTDTPKHEDMKLVLDVTGTISGIVVGGDGTPVPEVQVNAFPDILGGASTDGLALAGMSSATTDGAGAFKITGLPDGAYRLWAARPSGQQFGGWGGQNTSAKTGDKGVRITLASPGSVKGTITIEGLGAPKIANVGVGWRPPTPAQDGAFELTDLDPGSYDLNVRGPEFATFTQRDIKIEAGKTLDLGTITVHRGRKITGKVVDGKGRAVGGAKVKIGDILVFSDEQKENDDTDASDNIGWTRSAVSDQDGAFSIIGVTAKSTSVAADHPTAGRSASVTVPEGAQDPAPVTLTLRGFGSITGKVTQKGKPVSGVAVTHSAKGAGAQFSGAQTDDQGNFTLNKVPEGTVVLQAMQQSMMSLKSTTINVQVIAGRETKANIDIPVGQITLTVNVKAAANQQVDAAQVFLFAGTALPANGKQLMDSFVGGGAQGMKFWFGAGKPDPEFAELVPGDYSVCSIPITGDMNDPQFMARLNENVATLKVYCRAAKLTAAPLAQAMTQELPAMTPLPAPAPN